MKRYEIIEHTADIGIRAYGRDLKELFANAAYGCFEVLADLDNVRLLESVDLTLEAENLEELLVSWLRELLYKCDSLQILFKDFQIKRLEQNRIDATARGERLHPQRHRFKAEIKAVTYHELKIEKIAGVWTVQVIFDV
jgi:SHS2 domain-containing protein